MLWNLSRVLKLQRAPNSRLISTDSYNYYLREFGWQNILPQLPSSIQNLPIKIWFRPSQSLGTIWMPRKYNIFMPVESAYFGSTYRICLAFFLNTLPLQISFNFILCFLASIFVSYNVPNLTQPKAILLVPQHCSLHCAVNKLNRINQVQTLMELAFYLRKTDNK